MLEKIDKVFMRINRYVGYFLSVLMIIVMVNVFYNVVMRYVFSTGSIAMQEMEWHLFSVVFLIGISYALLEEGHVRVDVLYDRWPPQKKALINIIGTAVFIIPFALLIFFGSLSFVAEAYTSGEISGDPGGLHHRWLIKMVIPFSTLLLAITAFGYLTKNILIYRNGKTSQGGAQ